MSWRLYIPHSKDRRKQKEEKATVVFSNERLRWRTASAEEQITLVRIFLLGCPWLTAGLWVRWPRLRGPGCSRRSVGLRCCLPGHQPPATAAHAGRGPQEGRASRWHKRHHTRLQWSLNLEPGLKVCGKWLTQKLLWLNSLISAELVTVAASSFL